MKKFYLSLISIAAIALIYFGVNGVKAELSPNKTEVQPTPEVSNIAAPSSTVNQTKVTLRINTGSAVGNYPIPYIEGETAYQLLVRIASINHFTINATNYSWGIFVEGIGNLVQDGRDNFWFLYINGKSSEVGASDYIVKPNDLVEWRYHEYWIY